MNETKPIRLFAAAAMFAVAGHANAFLIDGFTATQVVEATTGTVFDDLTNTGSDFAGTSRRITVTNADGQTTANVNQLRPGILDLSNSTTASGVVTLLYTGILNIDFTGGGTNTGIYLGLPSPIQEPMTIAFDVNGSMFERTFPDGSEGNLFFFPFVDFSNPLTFLSVTSLAMTMSSTNDGWDASIDSLETQPTPVPQGVPLPGTLALMALGLGGLSLRRKNRA